MAAFVKNALDEEFYDGGFSLGDTVGADAIYIGRPRTFGFEATARF